MIRLPPTGISLSASDLDFHLHQINIYQGLLKQGFKKRDVLRYFEDQKQLEQQPNTLGDHELPTESPASTHHESFRPAPLDRLTVPESPLITIRLVQQDESISDLWSGDERVEGSSTSTASLCFVPGSPSSNRVRESLRSLCISSQSSDTQDTGELSRSSLSFTTPRDSIQTRHAPRQSSLLRFAHTVSSDSSEARAQFQHTVQPNSVNRRPSCAVMEDSENGQFVDVFKELIIDKPLATSNGRKWTPNRSFSSLDPEAPEFTPQALSSPFSNIYRAPSDEPSPPSVTRLQVHVSSNVESRPTTPSTSSQSIRDFPSSPPILQRSTTSMLNLRSTPSALSVLPTTPISRHNHLQAESEPHNQRFQHFDGTTFTVYDDSMPASGQPQTLADLLRRPSMNEFNAAYTAPPGVIHGIGFQSTIRSTLPDIGEQSPTQRAVGVRSRRNREFERGARVEELRIQRTRGRIRRSTQNGRPALLSNDIDLQQNDQRETDFWRDDLEADRVGEENFVEEPESPRQPVDRLRVVSGNERPRGL